MAYTYTNLIPENIAPKGTKGIGVYNSKGEKICSVPLKNLAPISREKQYSFGVISDLHISHSLYVTSQPVTKFDNALSFFENEGCVLCVDCGDTTNTGFYLKNNDSDASETPHLDLQQFEYFKEICDKHTIPVYEICGNHESYYGMPITNNLDKLKTYTGEDVTAYTVTQGEDVFVFVGQSRDTEVMSDNDLQWLYETLEENRNRRCFVFIHSHLNDDSGNPLNARDNSIFGYWGATKTTAFKNLMSHYKNIALVGHGHTHMKFESQTYDKCANYTDKNGFRSIHVPSLSVPREIINAEGEWEARELESYGYIVDVYDDCVVLNGMDIINQKPVPLGVYKIDTTITEIEANTFTDSTGTINTN